MVASLTSATLLLLGTVIPGCAQGTSHEEEVERIREMERERVRSLVDVDTVTAGRLHSDDFQLVNPAGAVLSKQEYLTALASGRLDYVAWEPGEITVRLHGEAAVLRYRDVRFEVTFAPDGRHNGPMYHTNLYERRAGAWRIVWSQASGVISP